MFRTVLVLSAFAVLATGCDADCADTARLNGTWAMWHQVLNAGAGGTATVDEDYPSYQMFINGWSKWKIKSSTSSGAFNVDVTDVAERQGDYNDGAPSTEPLAGTLTVDETNCNAFALHLEGTFSTTSGTDHAFTYDANAVYMGDHISGTFTYDDSYTGTDADGNATSGGLTGAAGELNATLQLDGFDTGFGE